MPAIYQRLCHSLRRRPRQPLREQTANAASTTPKQQQTSDLSDEEDETLDDGTSSPPPLPVISDRGPPTSNRYGDAGLFWNSTMHEADKKDKSWLSPSRPGKLQPEDEYTGRSRLPRYGFTRDVPLPKQNGYAQGQAIEPSAPRAAAARRNLDTSYANRNAERNISYGRERADNDLTVMYYDAPGNSYALSIPSRQTTPPRPQRSMSSEREHRPNVPFERPPPVNHVEPQQREPPVEVPASTSREFKDVQEGQPLDIIHAYRMPNPSCLSFSTMPREPMVWSSALGQILRNDHVDPDMKRQVRDRAKDSNTTNGDGEGEHFHVAPVAVGLVPNFSYPVAGSAFYDRRVADASESPDPNDQVTENVLGGESTAREHQPSTDIEQQDCDFGFGPSEPQGVPSHSFSSLPTYTLSLSSNKSTSPTTAPSCQPSSVDSIVSTHLNVLLLETLSKSQIELLNAALATPPDTPTSAPTLLRLTHSLHALLLHLQDRTLHFEANLLPQISAALESKTHTIDVQSAEIQNLDDQVTQLKATVDFSSRILTSCWNRDWEMWRTLNGIREGRRRGWWDFRRTRVSEDVDSGQRFSGRELDALVMIAEQNVGVLGEDVEDMVEKVEGCKRASATRPVVQEEEDVEPEEGSWRDV